MTVHASQRGHDVAGVTLAGVPRLIGWLRSEDFRQAVRVAVAMVIAYYVSLAMGWERPHWAGLAIALCSLATVGDSFNKGLLRILGTFLAGFVALLLIALFPQDRWHYMLGATLYIAFCTYMMGHSSRWYFWFIAGYVMPLLALTGGPEGGTAFETVVLRLQQTTLGVVVYTLVATLLWPRHSAPVLTETVNSLADVQRRLLGHYVAVLADAREDVDASKLRAQATGAVARLPAIVDGAELDSFETWEARHLWRRCAKDFAALNETMERWRQGFPDLERLDLRRLMPGLAALGPELDARLDSVARMLAGKPPQHSPEDIVLEFEEQTLGTLARFDRAALLRSRDQLQRMDRLTRALFSTIADIQGFGSKLHGERPTDMSSPAWTLDIDRLVYAVRSFTAVWIILFVCIYVPDFPMPAGVIPSAASFAIMLALMPQFPVLSLVVPVIGVVAGAGVFHVLVMPHLSSFVGLGTGIFIAIFLIMAVFAKPEQAIIRSIGTSLFVMVISVKNEQTYSFLFAVNFGLMFVLALVVVWVSSWFPISLGPAHVISKQLGRFFRSCERLASPRRQDTEQPLRRMWFAFDLHEVTTLPGKIGRWMAALPAAAFGKGTLAQARDLADALQALSDRMRELVEVRRAPQSAALVRDLTAHVHAWRLAIQEILRRLAVDPASVEAAQLRARLDATLESFEAQIEKAINAAPQGGTSPEEVDNMYRVLEAYRGVSEALVEVTGRAARIDWGALREAPF